MLPLSGHTFQLASTSRDTVNDSANLDCAMSVDLKLNEQVL